MITKNSKIFKTFYNKKVFMRWNEYIRLQEMQRTIKLRIGTLLYNE